MTENFPKLMTEANHRSKNLITPPSSLNTKKSTFRHTILECRKSKTKKKSWNKQKQKQKKKNFHLTHRGTRVRITLDFSPEIMQVKKEWSEI